MRIAIGLRGKNLTRDNLAFAAQLGCSDIVVTLFHFESLPVDSPWHKRSPAQRYAKSCPEQWTADYLKSISREAAEFGLSFKTIENFNPADYYDILLDGPRRQEQLDTLKGMLYNAAKAGITHIGYGFNPTGVWGRKKTSDFRGGAVGLTFDAAATPVDAPIPKGLIWDTVYDPYASEGDIGIISSEEIWQRFSFMMEHLLPVAAEYGISLCHHPTDPPLPSLRSTARLVYSLSNYQQLFSLFPQAENKALFCMGTIQEMEETVDISKTLEEYLAIGRVGYIHFRNVSGKVPFYREVFPDEGDIDMAKAVQVLKKKEYQGIIMPDHTPEMSVAQPWQTGMAYAVGYLKGL